MRKASLMGDTLAIEDARRLGFYPLVQLLERIVGGAPVGTSEAGAEERIHFRHDPALSFSTADVIQVRELPMPPGSREAEDAPRRAFEVTTSFLGLTGGVSPLPHYLAEEVAQEDLDAPRVRDFLDIFQHRLLSFAYRARAKYDVPSGWRSDLSDAWSLRLLALLGFDGSLPAGPSEIPRWRILRLAPLLADRGVTCHTLEVAIVDMLGPDLGDAAVVVDPFVGGWVDIALADQNRLGQRACRLGQDLVLGRRIVDVAGRFRVVIGPLSSPAYQRFAEGGPVRRVEQMIAALVSEPVEHEVILWLSEDAAPPARLGVSRVGRDSWLGGQKREIRIRADAAL